MNEKAKELCHAMTSAQKKAYNAEYYRNHKNYWEDYYPKGRTVGRQKYVTEGNGQGVKRRGSGLGTGPVGSKKGSKRTVASGSGAQAIESWSHLVGQTGDDLDAYAYNYAMDMPVDNSGWDLGAVQAYVNFDGGTIYDNAIFAIAAANGIVAKGAAKGKKIVDSLSKNWRVGMSSIRNLFKKKKK